MRQPPILLSPLCLGTKAMFFPYTEMCKKFLTADGNILLSLKKIKRLFCHFIDTHVPSNLHQCKTEQFISGENLSFIGMSCHFFTCE